ncbi:NmrA family NAD(P)-binding protein [Saccharothrix deserti]|uniref:NmrA family NAD(P)-binding protein n=1 Tax=Saccharothrix deserti TaxID=2593674 RepID=UPI00131DE5D3|nr:NmrA family NAD(P)-binding protein [Saccharothrix deserti]
MSAPSVLVLGATGLTGGAVVNRLLDAHRGGELRLIAAVRRPEAAAAFAEQGIEVRHIDLDAAERHGSDPVVAELRGVRRVFLASGYDVRMLAQAKVAIDAARLAGVDHVVRLGVHAAPETTVVHFGWHQLVDAYLERSGLGYTHLRPTAFMQNLLMPAMSDVASAVLTHYIGDAATSWVDTEDIAEVASVVLRSPADHHGRSYELGTEVATIGEIGALLSELTGRDWRYEPKGPAEFFTAMTAAGADPVYMDCVRNVFERTGEGSLSEVADTFDTVERVAGRAATSLRSFLSRHRRHFQPAPHANPRRFPAA